MTDTAAARLARPPLRLTCENSRLHKLLSVAHTLPALVLRPASGVCLCCAVLCRGGSRFYNLAARIVQVRWPGLPNLVPAAAAGSCVHCPALRLRLWNFLVYCSLEMLHRPS